MLRNRIYSFSFAIIVFISTHLIFAQNSNLTYPIVDTGQESCYDNSSSIDTPAIDHPFYGQDAQHVGIQAEYIDNGDGTITDIITGLMWQQKLYDDKYTFDECVQLAEEADLAGYDDWRLPTIKELYSLMDFSGITSMVESNAVPYINTDYFDFRYGGVTNSSERLIDAQYVSSTVYLGTTMNGSATVFGLNLADGRIKGYPQSKDFELRLVRGNEEYGINKFVDNNDNTITDSSTGLMWMKQSSEGSMNWEEALLFAQEMNKQELNGYSDWRLPNAKELHSLVDYSRSPQTTNEPAIDPMFEVPEIIDEGGNANYPFYWTSTTHNDGPYPNKAVYICFGEALGFMSFPPTFNYELMDVHGAGAQRSDPKAGDPDDYPYGHGPQGDVIRIYNYVRLVRDAENVTTDVGQTKTELPESLVLEQNYPNPFNPSTTIAYTIPVVDVPSPAERDKLHEGQHVSLKIYDILGNEVATLVNEQQSPGNYSVNFEAGSLSSSVYLYTLSVGGKQQTKKMIFAK